MVAFSFRRAQEADFDLLRRLHRAGMKAHVTELWGWDDEVQDGLLRERFEPERLSVIVSGGRDIGILQVSREPGSMRLDNILIDPAWQGRGIGSAILSDLAAEARGAGTALSLSVLKPNPAKALYERMGFVVVGEDEFRYAMAYRPLAAIRRRGSCFRPALGSLCPARRGRRRPHWRGLEQLGLSPGPRRPRRRPQARQAAPPPVRGQGAP
jgi:ribosomal protein S18 acetylase RimI-like enzyme